MRAVSQPSPSPARCASRIRTCHSRSTTPRRSSGAPTAIPSGSRSWVTSATSTSPGPRPGSSRRTASAKPAQGIERGVMTSDTARMYIDGKWVHARGGATFDVVNPADGSVVATVSDAGPSEAQRAVEAAHGAFREWSARPARERAQVLLNIQSLMEERRDVLARLITTENGKPFEEARKEVQFALAYFGWFAEQARRVTGEWVPSPHAGKRTWVLRQPVGPVAAVTPWNFPATMVTRKIAPALAAGCSVVLKPSPATPLTALAIARIADDAGLPPGTFNVVTASPARTLQEELLNHPLIRRTAFTGSTATGRAIMAGAASQIQAARFRAARQRTVHRLRRRRPRGRRRGRRRHQVPPGRRPVVHRANRIYVHRSVADRFVPAFVDAVRALRVGP